MRALKFSQITPGMIERFLMKLAETKTRYDRMFSPVTIRMHYERINRVFNYAKRERVFMGDNPCGLVNPEILKNFPTWQPREHWLNQCDEEEETRLFQELSPTISAIGRILFRTLECSVGPISGSLYERHRLHARSSFLPNHES